MENQRENEGFQYTYSAQEQEELRRLRQKYLPPEKDKMEQLRRMDAAVTVKGTTISILVGVLGTLILGAGMCCCLVWQGAWFVPGILIGLLGMALAASAYPIHLRVVKKEREKIAPEILRLTDELMK